MGGAIRETAGMVFISPSYLNTMLGESGLCLLLPPENWRDSVLPREAAFCLYVMYKFRCSLLLMFGDRWEVSFVHLLATIPTSDPKLNF